MAIGAKSIEIPQEKIMLLKVFALMMFSTFAYADQAESLLDSDAVISEFGNIKYRSPKVSSNETPIVLFHGIYGGASHRTWRNLVPELEAAGKEVYVMDLPGVGESDKPKRSYSIEDLDRFVEIFISEVVGERANLVSESILSNAALRVAAERPDLVRRVVALNPSGIYSLVEPPSAREQNLYDRLYNDDEAAIGFYSNLLTPSSVKYFLGFSFYDDSLVSGQIVEDALAERSNFDQRYITLSFVGGQLYRSFRESSEGVFVPVLAIFGSEYEAFQDNKIARAVDFKAIRPYFEYREIANSGSSVQREKPAETAQEIIEFLVKD
jgi:pimeloyl-ACP methyl ester carboxylesterase